jgi:hypothetical protein
MILCCYDIMLCEDKAHEEIPSYLKMFHETFTYYLTHLKEIISCSKNYYMRRQVIENRTVSN